MKRGYDRFQILLPFKGLEHCSAAPVSAHEESAGPSPNHHLHWERHKGWILRVTVEIGRKVVGKRLKYRLGTNDLAEARARRDLLIRTLESLGLKVVKSVCGPKRSDNQTNN